jgi:hypothetical protein
VPAGWWAARSEKRPGGQLAVTSRTRRLSINVLEYVFISEEGIIKTVVYIFIRVLLFFVPPSLGWFGQPTLPPTPPPTARAGKLFTFEIR